MQLAQQNKQQNVQGGQPVVQGQQQPLLQQQHLQNGAVMMNQGQPGWGAAAGQNQVPVVAGGQPNQAQGLNLLANFCM